MFQKLFSQKRRNKKINVYLQFDEQLLAEQRKNDQKFGEKVRNAYSTIAIQLDQKESK